jgi:CTP:molybdopterin cytidylyltransferase MocA
MLRKAILILAAGASSRFGTPKQLARIRSKTLIQRAYDCATQLFPDDTFVVLGAHRNTILEELTAANSIPQSRILYNRNWAFGIGESINVGVQVLENQYDEIMIILADQVQITPRDIQRLLDSCVGDAIICADYNGSRGVPAIFPKKAL